MDQLTQGLGLPFRTRLLAGQQHHVALRRRAIPAVNRFPLLPVGCWKVTVEVNAAGIGAQAELTAIRIDRQHHVVAAQLGFQGAQGAGEGHNRRILITVGTGNNQPATAVGLRRRKPQQRRAQFRAAILPGSRRKVAALRART